MKNQSPENKSAKLPFETLRQVLVPDTLVYVTAFDAADVPALMEKVNKWVDETMNIIVIAGPISRLSPNELSIAVSYVTANKQ